MNLNIRWVVVLILAVSLIGLVLGNKDVFFGKNSMIHVQGDQYFVAGHYEKYSEDKMAFVADKQIILFFSAPWCPTCSTFNEEMLVAVSTLPDNILILAVDYDTHADLRKKYKIAYQHVFVVLDQKGVEIKRWSGGGVNKLKQELGL